MNKRLLVVCVLCLSASATGADIYVAFWNVENLFDTVDDSAVAKDEEFTPDAPKQWTDERFNTKLKNLARVIRDMNKGRGPDVLGLSEVENRFVIEKLIEQLAPLGRDYAIVHKDSPSNRGIDCALIYDRTTVKLKSSRFIHVPAGKTRDIVEVELNVSGDSLFVFVNHWPSRGGDRTGAMRAIAAKKLRSRIDAILASKRNADILVIGDLNDFPADPSVREHLGAVGKADSLKPRALFNSTAAIHDVPGQGTYNYRGEWEVIDHVILSRGLLDDKGFTWKRASTVVVMEDYQLYRAGTPEARPNRTYGGNRYFGGYSDHLPVACVVAHR